MQNDLDSAASPDIGGLSRRFFVLAAPALLTAACTTAGVGTGSYGVVSDGRVTLPAMDTTGIDPRWLRQTVEYRGSEPVGTVVVRPSERHLYFVTARGTAVRYGVGVGRQGALWHGRATIGRKGQWPNWTPTANMIRYDPRNARYAGGMPGGLGNPLGARALYLYRGNRDTMYRLHGTNVPSSIGTAVSSGCIRLFNHDIIDLHDRVRIGTPVVVIPG